MRPVKSRTMIESCSSKHMLLAIVVLGGIMYLTLVYESQWTFSNNQIGLDVLEKNISASSEFCWCTEMFKIVKPCKPCTDFEIRSKSIPACEPTHYSEAVLCLKSNQEVYRSCGNTTWLKEAQFWSFELRMIVAGVISSVFVYIRQQVLDHRMARKIQRQLACNI